MAFGNDCIDILNDAEAAAEMALLLSRRPQSPIIVLHEFDENYDWMNHTVFRNGQPVKDGNYRIAPMRWPESYHSPFIDASGFTIVELLLVIVAIGLFAAAIVFMVKKVFTLGLIIVAVILALLMLLAVFGPRSR